MKVRDLLPIGSIVLLKNGEKRLMITGIMQGEIVGLFRKIKTYDYIGVIYPEGYIDDTMRYLFNHDDIVNVLFRGFEDEERIKFISDLAKEIEEQWIYKKKRRDYKWQI